MIFPLRARCGALRLYYPTLEHTNIHCGSAIGSIASSGFRRSKRFDFLCELSSQIDNIACKAKSSPPESQRRRWRGVQVSFRSLSKTGYWSPEHSSGRTLEMLSWSSERSPLSGLSPPAWVSAT
ncbi:hypothetical protein ABEF92_003516 [Exophiala dermatitidis]|uniref:Uncharacterized protein n=1 Tax=Exophiala dermatitidis (strain ATCC 34100 / CBS 525.76 / NIH/UT8656) TaxID=858893 RepID=H6C8V2_EXODN|nr:uncharacterized protein HMPREF1120_08486 [Exophiala dermatitidis NIH/UT8656]EHY60530.1 hypothetical protein HMPREF1120_08486 [Exophiala dermatitidis NIH/UT8656]